MTAEFVAPEDVAVTAVNGRGLVCLPIDLAMVERLEIPDTVGCNNARSGTGFTDSISAKEGVTAGISADRARTSRVAVDPYGGPGDLAIPGHVLPLRAKLGAVLQHAGHTEAAVDQARLAGFSAAGIVCEAMNGDEPILRLPDRERFAARHGLMMVSSFRSSTTVIGHAEYARLAAEADSSPEPD